MKKVLLSLALTISLFAKETLVDAVSVVVENEIITMYDIFSIKKELKVDNYEAVEMLVLKALQNSEIKRLGIVIDDFEVNKEIERVANSNNLTLFQFKEVLKQKFMDIKEYENSIRERLLQERLYRKLTQSKLEIATEDELKNYYNSNLDTFLEADSFEVIKYSSKSKSELEKALSSVMVQTNVKKEELIIGSKSLDGKTKFLLNDTKEGYFTPPIAINGEFVAYYIVKQLNKKPKEFHLVRDFIFMTIMQEREEKVIKEYFDKLKLKTNVKIVRLPS